MVAKVGSLKRRLVVFSLVRISLGSVFSFLHFSYTGAASVVSQPLRSLRVLVVSCPALYSKRTPT